MNEFDKRMAELTAARRREFWDKVTILANTAATGLAVIVIVGTLIWWPW